MTVKKIIAAGLAAGIVFTVSACEAKGNGPSSDTSETDTLQEVEGNIDSFDNAAYFNFYGRNTFGNDTEKLLCIPNTAGGFEFRFYGTECFANMKSVHSTGADNWYAVATVTVDGSDEITDVSTEETVKNKVAIKNDKLNDVPLASGLDEGWHTVKVEKCTQDFRNRIYLNGVSCDGKFSAPPEKPERKIEVFGDSITCGHSNLRLSNDALDSDGEDGMQTYATLTAKKLNAQVNVLSKSGIVLGNYNNNECIQTSLKHVSVGLPYDEWDLYDYIPDAVVILLGTNDNTYINKYANLTPAPSWQAFENKYKEFLTELQGYYGQNVTFFLCCGLWNPWQAERLEPILNRIKTSLSDMDIEVVKFADKTSSIHPSVADHTTASEILTAKIKECKGW
ncbi:MAG: GDSL-type esterase/lipase family protein [Candidatus Scatosoma sp.]